MKIGWDLDGVLYDFVGCLRSWMEWVDPDGAEEGKYKRAASTWEFFETDWGMTLQEFKQAMQSAAVDGHLYSSGGVVDGMAEVVEWAQEQGHANHIVTHRAEYGAKNNTEVWLARYGIPYDSLTFCSDKTIVNVDVLIEDRGEHLDGWFRGTDKPGILVEQAWNEEWRRYYADRYYSDGRLWIVKDGEELQEVLQRLADREEARETREQVAALYAEAIETQQETVLQEANRLIYGDRQQDYGHPIEDFTKTAGMWSSAFGWHVEPEDVPLAMIMVKISREKNKTKRDNAVDIAGYAGTLAMVREAQQEYPPTRKAG